FEASRGDDLEDSAWLVSCVPKRVPFPTRLMHKVARTCLELLIAQQRSHSPLNHEAVLVLVGVAMQRRRQGSRRHRMFHKRKPVPCLASVHHEANTDTPQKPRLAVCRGDDLCC